MGINDPLTPSINREPGISSPPPASAPAPAPDIGHTAPSVPHEGAGQPTPPDGNGNHRENNFDYQWSQQGLPPVAQLPHPTATPGPTSLPSQYKENGETREPAYEPSDGNGKRPRKISNNQQNHSDTDAHQIDPTKKHNPVSPHLLSAAQTIPRLPPNTTPKPTNNPEGFVNPTNNPESQTSIPPEKVGQPFNGEDGCCCCCCSVL
ncbi:hypothetical protein Nepgr_009627 [Nepenthes gracilis]|uniref:Uncharacterized protein n=1 Tax=Nepenthes gracilis TaxID=150966 RepID=A0AAD3SBP0_NEPGR|nr:hypothetical protein Nepgr_009627 [Nepenthes gracilis]